METATPDVAEMLAELRRYYAARPVSEPVDQGEQLDLFPTTDEGGDDVP